MIISLFSMLVLIILFFDGIINLVLCWQLKNQDTFNGNIKNIVITEKVVKYPDRAEADRFFNYPYAAIEESLANAVYHKAYDEREPIEVRINKNMIEIISHPGPDRSVTLQGLKEYKVYSRRYRNRRIGEFLKDLHLTEGRNTGFKKIIDALQLNGSPMPEFETDDAHDYFVSRLYIHPAFTEEISQDNKTSDKPSIEVLFEGLSMDENALLVIIKKAPYATQTFYAQETSFSLSKVQRIMKKLQENKIIWRCGAKKNGSWEIEGIKRQRPLF